MANDGYRRCPLCRYRSTPNGDAMEHHLVLEFLDFRQSEIVVERRFRRARRRRVGRRRAAPARRGLAHAYRALRAARVR